ncbi:MAG: PilZ domain-containing protein [Candidatus Aureabacteria bacterium]|nr:PilZ domain-containing protein [Candidatus Auribacterota bacterium]
MKDYAGPERRRFVRVPFIFPVKYTVVEDEEKTEYHALSDNLSEGGIKIICMNDVQEGCEILLRFSLPTSEGIVDIACRGKVVWYKESSKRRFCGVQFVKVNEEDQLVLRNFVKKILEFRGIE